MSQRTTRRQSKWKGAAYRLPNQSLPAEEAKHHARNSKVRMNSHANEQAAGWPGDLSLRRGTLAHRRLAKRQLISTVCKTCVGLRMLPLHCIPYSGMTVQEPTAQGLEKHWQKQASDLMTSQSKANKSRTKTLQLPNCSSAKRLLVHPCIISVIALYAIVAV